MLHIWYIFPYIWVIFRLHVGKCSSTMERLNAWDKPSDSYSADRKGCPAWVCRQLDIWILKVYFLPISHSRGRFSHVYIYIYICKIICKLYGQVILHSYLKLPDVLFSFQTCSETPIMSPMKSQRGQGFH